MRPAAHLSIEATTSELTEVDEVQHIKYVKKPLPTGELPSSLSRMTTRDVYWKLCTLRDQANTIPVPSDEDWSNIIDQTAILSEKSEHWMQWEAQGYRDEILKSAEGMLVGETISQHAGDAIKDLDVGNLIPPATGADDKVTPPYSSSEQQTMGRQRISHHKKLFQKAVSSSHLHHCHLGLAF